MIWIIQYHDRMPSYSIAAGRHSLPEEASRRLAATASSLVDSLPVHRPLTIGIGGAPGTGKSTLARSCASQLDDSLILSLDDYYLPRAQRMHLAETIHPLLAMRGVPGTHDIDLLCDHLAQLKDPQHAGLDIPQFDKQLDDRRPTGMHIPEKVCPQIIFLEGWIVGVPPQQEHELQTPVNALESDRDASAQWRQWVNHTLARYARQLEPQIDVCWQLLAPDWETVIEWRWAQEQQLSQRWLQSREEVAAFLAPFQRLCGHIQQHGHTWADRVIELDHDHCPTDRKTTP